MSTGAVGVAPAPPVPQVRRWVPVAAVAALVGALVGPGAVALLNEDTGGTSASGGRPSARLAEPGDTCGVLERVEPAV